MICKACMKVHGKDTKDPVLCPHCGKTLCFWHMKYPLSMGGQAHNFHKCEASQLKKEKGL